MYKISIVFFCFIISLFQSNGSKYKKKKMTRLKLFENKFNSISSVQGGGVALNWLIHFKFRSYYVFWILTKNWERGYDKLYIKKKKNHSTRIGLPMRISAILIKGEGVISGTIELILILFLGL